MRLPCLTRRCVEAFISNSPDQLFLKCTNCGAIFNSSLRMSHESFNAAIIEDTTYK